MLFESRERRWLGSRSRIGVDQPCPTSSAQSAVVTRESVRPAGERGGNFAGLDDVVVVILTPDAGRSRLELRNNREGSDLAVRSLELFELVHLAREHLAALGGGLVGAGFWVPEQEHHPFLPWVRDRGKDRDVEQDHVDVAPIIECNLLEL